MRRIWRPIYSGVKGFTLVELLIVVAILGILAAVIVPNLSSFLSIGNLAGANTEAANIETAAMAYYVDNDGIWPETSADLMEGETDYLSNAPKGNYTFDTSIGQIDNAEPGSWTGIVWDSTRQQWVTE